MEINGNYLTPIRDVNSFVSYIFGDDEHKKRVQSVANAVIGVLSAASLIVHRIGRGLAGFCGLDDKHAIKQVDRLLSNKKLNAENFFCKWIPYLTGGRPEIKVALDWTIFDPDKQATIQLSLVTSHGRTTPLVWKTVRKAELESQQYDYEKEVLEVLKKYVGNTKVTVLADRGFGDIERYRYIKGDLGFDYIIRFRSKTYITDEKGEMRLASKWVPDNNTIKTIRNARVTAKKYFVPTVVCFRDKKMKDSWCIASSLGDISGSEIVHWYSKRWGIETQFRDTKDLHFGMGLSETKISNPERRDRIFIINAIATAYLTLLGAAGEKLGFDKALKANTVKKRVLSLLRQGCIHFNKLMTYPREKTKQLLQEFFKLIQEQNYICETLSWI